MKKTPPTAALGVYVAPDTIEAVLLRRNGERTEAVQRFVRQRAAQGQFSPTSDLALAVPGLKGSDDADYTLEVGDGSSSGGTSLLPSELARLGVSTDTLERGGGKSPASRKPPRPTFGPQLKELLQECRALGYEHPDVAFCIAPPDITYVDLPMPDAKGNAGTETEPDARAASVVTSEQRKRLLDALPLHYNGAYEAERVAFVPLAAARGQHRALAIVADPDEPVAPTLAALREQRTAVAPESRFLDAEASVYAALLAHTLKPAPDEQSAVVRVGTEDTLVLFFNGTHLLHLERLRSLTAFDAPETICSRVLLQQDEKRIGRLHNVFVSGAGRNAGLLDAFRAYYDTAAVEPMQRVLTDTGLALPEDDDHFGKAQVLPALAVGLRLLEKWETAAEVNLLPRGLQRRRRELRLAWHTVVALLLLVGVLAFGVARFQARAAELREANEELVRNPIAYPEQSPAVLQHRVDSLARVHATYTRALHVLDSLLVGSDKWITTMERIAKATGRTPGTWVDHAVAEGPQAIRMNGHALSRLAIVELARRLNGAIEQLNYQDVGQRRVFSYEMVFPAPEEMPAAATYLRKVRPEDAPPEGPAEIHPALHAHD